MVLGQRAQAVAVDLESAVETGAQIFDRDHRRQLDDLTRLEIPLELVEQDGAGRGRDCQKRPRYGVSSLLGPTGAEGVRICDGRNSRQSIVEIVLQVGDRKRRS